MAQPIEATPAMKTALQPLLQHAPEMFRIGSDMATKTYRLVFSPTVTRALKDGTAELLPSADKLLAVARGVDKKKKFIQIGRVVEEGGVRSVNIAAASWQILSIITAQHYLPEINQRLQRIEDRLKDIQFFQHEEKRSEIRADVELLKQYYEAISRTALHPQEIAAVYQKLEDIEERCLALSELGRRLAEEEVRKLGAIQVKEILDPLGTGRQASEWVNRCKEMVELVYLAESCRMVGCYVKAALPGDRALVASRVEDAKRRIRASADHVVALQEQFHQKIVRPLDPSGDFFRSLLNYRNHGRDAAEAFERVRTEVVNMSEALDKQASRAREIAAHFEQLASSGLVLDVSMDQDGNIKLHPATSA